MIAMIHTQKCGVIGMSGREGELTMKDAIDLFTMVVQGAIPYGVAFALGQLIVDTFMRMAFGGKVEF